MAKVYSWQVKETPREYAYIVNPAYILNPTTNNKVYIGAELSGKNLEMVMNWALNCTVDEYISHFNTMVEACSGYNVKFEDVEAYMGIKSTCDNLRGPAGRGISKIEEAGTKDGGTVYAIRYDDGTYDTFTVKDGKDGANGSSGAQGDAGVSTALIMLYACGKDFIDEETGDYNVTVPTGVTYNFVDKKIEFYNEEENKWKTGDTVNPPVFSTNAIVYSDGGDKVYVTTWTKPVQITGENGAPGEDGESTEFIYKLADYVSKIQLNKDEDNYVPTNEGWTDSPQGVDEDNQTEWMSMRRKLKTKLYAVVSEKDKDGNIDVSKLSPTPTSHNTEIVDEIPTEKLEDEKKVYLKLNKTGEYYKWSTILKWGNWSDPSIWSKYGVNGQDGDGVQYIYMKNKGTPPVNPTPADYSTNDAYQEVNNEWLPPIGVQYESLIPPPENHPNRANDTDIIYRYEENDETKIIGVWTDNPNEVDLDYKFSWVSVRKYKKTENPINKFIIVKEKKDLLELSKSKVSSNIVYYVQSEGLYFKIKNVDKYTSINSWSSVKYKNGSNTKIVREIVNSTKLNEEYIDENNGKNEVKYYAVLKEDFNGTYSYPSQNSYIPFNFYVWQDSSSSYVMIENTPDDWNLRIIIEGDKFWTAFKDPTLWAKFGEDGSAGKNGRARSIRKYYKVTEDTSTVPDVPKSVNDIGQWLSAFPKTIANGGTYEVGKDAVWCSEAEIWCDTLEFVSEYKLVSERTENGEVIITHLNPQPTEGETGNTVDVDYIPENKIDDKLYIKYNGDFFEWKTASFGYPYLMTGTKGPQGAVGSMDYISTQFAFCLERISPPVGDVGQQLKEGEMIPVTLTDDKYDIERIIYWEDFPDTNSETIDEWYGIPRTDGYIDGNGDRWRWYRSEISMDVSNQTIKKWGKPVLTTGHDGLTGNKYEFRYGVTENTRKPFFKKTDEFGNQYRNPTLENSKHEKVGWFTTADVIPETPVGGAVWQIFAELDANENFISEWSDPVKVSGEKGEQGLPGPVGLRGTSGVPGVGFKNKFCLGTQLDENENGPNWYWDNISLDDNGEPNVDVNENLLDIKGNVIKRGQGYFGLQSKKNDEGTYVYSSIYSGEFIPEEELINWYNNDEIPTDTKLSSVLVYDNNELSNLDALDKINGYLTATTEDNKGVTRLKNRGRILEVVKKVNQKANTSNDTVTTYQYFLVKDIEIDPKNNKFQFSGGTDEIKTRLIYLTSKLTSSERENFNITTWCISGGEEFELGKTGEYTELTEAATESNTDSIEYELIPDIQITGYSYIKVYGEYYKWDYELERNVRVYPAILTDENTSFINEENIIDENAYDGNDFNKFIDDLIKSKLPTNKEKEYICVNYQIRSKIDNDIYNYSNYYEWTYYQGDQVEHKVKGVKWGSPFKIQGIAGLKGIAGNRGQMVYPMGVYNQEEVYECDNTRAPYVYDPSDGLFYVYNDTTTPWVGTKPKGYEEIRINPIDAENNYIDVTSDPEKHSGRFKDDIDNDDKRYVRYTRTLTNGNQQYEYYEWDNNSQKYENRSPKKYYRNGTVIEDQTEIPSKSYANILEAGNRAPVWVRFESFEVIYAKLGIIQNGSVGSAVFNNEFMFSQQGETGSVSNKETSENYRDFLSGYDFDNSLELWYYKKRPDLISVNDFYKWYNNYTKTDENGLEIDAYLYFDSKDDRYVNPYEKLPTGVTVNDVDNSITITYDDDKYLHNFRPNVCINFESGQAWFRTGRFAIGQQYNNTWNIEETKENYNSAIERAKEEISANTENIRKYIQEQLDGQGVILDQQVRSYIQDTDPSMVVAVHSENDPSESWDEIDANYKIGYVWKNVYDNYNGHDHVDLGLEGGIKWAKYNVGSNRETDTGLYFAWGETQGYTKDEVNNNKRDFIKNKYKVTKYNSTDNKVILDLEDDAAHVNMGGDWRMPTQTDLVNLDNGTDKKWTTINGVKGITFTSKNDKSKSLFIPAAGFCVENLSNEGVSGYIWSSSLDRNVNVDDSIRMSVQDEIAIINSSKRYYGLNVRGVILPEKKYNYYSFELITETNNINTENGDVACSNDLLKNKYFWKKLDTLKESDKKELWDYWRTSETPSYLYAESRLGDIWTTSNGRTYNFVKKSGNNKYTKECVNNLLESNYIWAESDIPQSIHDYIDGKNTIYTSIPTGKTVYSGDMWFLEHDDYKKYGFYNGTNENGSPKTVTGLTKGTCVICMFSGVTSDSVENFPYEKWGKRDDYADNVRVDQAFDEMNEMEKYLEDCASDKMLSPQERKVLYEELKTIINEYPIITGDAEMLGNNHTAVTSYTESYNTALNAFIDNHIIVEATDGTVSINNKKYKCNDATSASTINNSYSSITEYYTARQTLLTAISAYLDYGVTNTNNMIKSWDDDGYLSPDELRMLKKEYFNVSAEREILLKQAENAGITSGIVEYYSACTEYNTAWNNFITAAKFYLSGTTDDYGNVMIVTGDSPYNYDKHITGYYAKKTQLQDAISSYIKKFSKEAIDELQENLEDSKVDIVEINDVLTGITQDGVITKFEKRSLLNEWEEMKNDYSSTVNLIRQYYGTGSIRETTLKEYAQYAANAFYHHIQGNRDNSNSYFLGKYIAPEINSENIQVVTGSNFTYNINRISQYYTKRYEITKNIDDLINEKLGNTESFKSKLNSVFGNINESDGLTLTDAFAVKNGDYVTGIFNGNKNLNDGEGNTLMLGLGIEKSEDSTITLYKWTSDRIKNYDDNNNPIYYEFYINVNDEKLNKFLEENKDNEILNDSLLLRVIYYYNFKEIENSDEREVFTELSIRNSKINNSEKITIKCVNNIINGDDEFETSLTFNSGYTKEIDKEHLSLTKIYDNGKIITKDIDIIGGTINATINASGIFSGYVKNEEIDTKYLNSYNANFKNIYINSNDYGVNTLITNRYIQNNNFDDVDKSTLLKLDDLDNKYFKNDSKDNIVKHETFVLIEFKYYNDNKIDEIIIPQIYAAINRLTSRYDTEAGIPYFNLYCYIDNTKVSFDEKNVSPYIKQSSYTSKNYSKTFSQIRIDKGQLGSTGKTHTCKVYVDYGFDLPRLHTYVGFSKSISEAYVSIYQNTNSDVLIRYESEPNTLIIATNGIKYIQGNTTFIVSNDKIVLETGKNGLNISEGGILLRLDSINYKVSKSSNNYLTLTQTT